MIEAYVHQETPIAIVSKKIKRGRQAIYNVYHFLKQGKIALEYLEQYKKNKKRCGRKSIEIPKEEKEYIEDKTIRGWTPDVIVGRGEFSISCSVRTVYRRFKNGEFDQNKLPMQGKRKPNGHQKRC